MPLNNPVRPTYAQVVTGTALAATGLTGTAAPSRLVGSNASGAPLTGTFVAGDFTVDTDGTIWVCTVAGTPGTWVQSAGGGGGGSVTAVTASTPLTATAGTTPNIQLPVTGVIAQTVPITGTAMVSSGLTGSTASSRYVGATANGAPIAGDYLLGDFVIDQTGSLWICTTSGTPGTWAQLGANQYPGPPVSGVSGASPITSTGGTIPSIGLDTTAALAQTNTITGTVLVASGITGATAASRHAGATVAGAPLSGTFAKGDFVVDQTGSIWICTTSGTPGNWVQLGAVAAGGSPVTGVSAASPLQSTGGTTPQVSLPTSGVIAQTVPITGQALVASGLTGSTAASRYVGATASGRPLTGTYIQGDFVVDRTGSIWICTVGGTSGTWVQLGAAAAGGSPVTGVSGTSPIVSTGGTTPAISFDATYAINQSNTITGTALKASGLTGAQTATRYVGGTASVAPTTGTFAVGDYVITQNGKMWVCITAGTPGTWVQVGAQVAAVQTLTMISRYTVPSSQATITFSSIVSASYKDLRLEWNGHHDAYTSTGNIIMSLNGGSALSEPFQTVASTTAGAVTWTSTAGTEGATSMTIGTVGGAIGQGYIDFMTSSGGGVATSHQRFVAFSVSHDGTNKRYGWYHGRFSGNGLRVTTIALTTTGTWRAGTVFTLFGVAL